MATDIITSADAPASYVAAPSRRWVWIALIAIAIGVACRLAQYLSNQSFWGDEAYLILNLRDKSPAQLLGSLTMSVGGQILPPQTAAPLYLLSLKALAAVFGESEFTYRLPALMLGVLGLPLLALLAWRVLSPPAAAAVVGWAALSDRFIDGSVVVKQYAGDLAVAILLTLLTIKLARLGAAKRLAVVSLVSAAAVWFSEPVVFLMGGIGLALLPQILRDFRGVKGWLIWAVLCLPAAGSTIVLYAVSMRYQQSPVFLQFWSDYFPNYSHPFKIPWWTIKQIYLLCNYPYRPLGVIILLLAILGIVRLHRAGNDQFLAILTFPIALTLLAAIAHVYPFGGTRVDGFLVANTLILAGAGLSELARRLPSPRQWALLAATPMVASGLWQDTVHLIQPRCSSQLRPAVQWVQKQERLGDSILLIGDGTWSVFYVYWPNPAGLVQFVDGKKPTHVSGRFWCVCEYAPGEFARKRKPAIDVIASGATPIPSAGFVGKGGAALLFKSMDSGAPKP